MLTLFIPPLEKVTCLKRPGLHMKSEEYEFFPLAEKFFPLDMEKMPSFTRHQIFAGRESRDQNIAVSHRDATDLSFSACT